MTTAVVALLGAGACGAPMTSSDEDSAAAKAREAAAAAVNAMAPASNGAAAARANELPHPAAGYVRLDSSLIDPWCGAVLVDRTTAVTTANCVLHRDASELSVGFGLLEAGPRYRVARVVVHPEYTPDTDGRHNLAALVLTTPVTDVAPARVAATQTAAPDQGCDLEAVSYTFVARDDAAAAETSGRRAVAGCAAEPDAIGTPGVRFPGGAPNCHGDSGAGVFVGDGAVLGVVSHVTGFVTNPETGLRCADTLGVTPLAAEGAFFAGLGVSLAQ